MALSRHPINAFCRAIENRFFSRKQAKKFLAHRILTVLSTARLKKIGSGSAVLRKQKDSPPELQQERVNE
jgi:hypothetical protein